MEKKEYNHLIENNRLLELSYTAKAGDLIKYQYKNLYLIEYLLREDIRDKRYDTYAQHYTEWAVFYLKYHITKPLLKMNFNALMTMVDGKRFLDILLGNLTDFEKIDLYDHMKKEFYWQVHDYEQEIIAIYKKHGMKIKQIFIKSPSVFDFKAGKRKSDNELLNEFSFVFKDSSDYILNVYLHELKRGLSIDSVRTRDIIEKLIRHKINHDDFNLKLTVDGEGEYDGDITINPKVIGVMYHELSHFFRHNFTKADRLQYEKLRRKVDNDDTKTNIINYLKILHSRYDDMKSYFEAIYDREVKKQYGSMVKYEQAVFNDLYVYNTKIVSVRCETMGDFNLYVNEYSIIGTAHKLLEVEKAEFVNDCIKNYYSVELTLENLLDALLNGAIYDGLAGIECLSGHESLYYMQNKDASFDECLADYEEILNSKRKNKILNDLEMLVGSELIDFLENYIEKERNEIHSKKV